MQNKKETLYNNVLLILAGISISMLTGNNSILNKAGEAKEATIEAQEKERVELAYISAAMKKLGDDVTAEELQNELNSSVGSSKTKVSQKSTKRLNVIFKDSKNKYSVTDGKVEKIELEDGIYVGNVRLGGINPFSFETYDAYSSSTAQEEDNISIFFKNVIQKQQQNQIMKMQLMMQKQLELVQNGLTMHIIIKESG